MMTAGHSHDSVSLDDRGKHMRDYHKGLIFTGAGVLLISPDALLIRLIDAPPMDLLFWRGMMMFLIMGALIIVRERRDYRAFFARFGWPVVIAAAIAILMYFCFVNAITHTTAANALFILAAAPLLAAIVGRVFFAEKLSWFTWVAAVVVVALIGAIAGNSIAAGGGLGVLSALGAALTLALFFTVFRAFPDISRLQVFTLAGGLMALVCSQIATPFDFTGQQMTFTLILTVCFLPIATYLMTMGPRYLPAAEASLLILLESVLGPLWVYLVIGEVPSTTTMICGSAILLVVGWHTLMATRKDRALAGNEP